MIRDTATPEKRQEEPDSGDERFCMLSEISLDTVWQVDSEFRILNISNTNLTILGFVPEELIGMSILEIMNAEDAAKARRINAERLKQEQQGIRTGRLRNEVQFKSKNGEFILTEIDSCPLRNSEGLITGYIGAIRDISERKRIEKESAADKHKLLKTMLISDGYQAQLLELNSRIKEIVEKNERSRLYRDLHDGAGQSLHAICLRLKMLADGRGGYDDPKTLAAELAQEVADVAAELRDIAHQRRPSYLHEITLDTAIARRCEMLDRRGVPVDVVCTGDFSTLPYDISDNFFRISQEVLANAARHAGARLITVRLTRRDSGLRLLIADDGCGMKEKQQDSDGMGLRIMQERAKLIGATLEISSSTSGTTISVSLDKI